MRDYPLLINVFLEFRAVMNSLDNGFTIQNLSLLVGSCSDAFLKHDAWLQEMIDCNRRNMLNPVSCFGEGIRYIVGLPFDILYWLGIINKNRNVQIHNNLILRLLGSVVSLISFLGSVISIVVGWKSFIIICSSLKNFIK